MSQITQLSYGGGIVDLSTQWLDNENCELHTYFATGQFYVLACLWALVRQSNSETDRHNLGRFTWFPILK